MIKKLSTLFFFEKQKHQDRESKKMYLKLLIGVIEFGLSVFTRPTQRTQPAPFHRNCIFCFVWYNLFCPRCRCAYQSNRRQKVQVHLRKEKKKVDQEAKSNLYRYTNWWWRRETRNIYINDKLQTGMMAINVNKQKWFEIKICVCFFFIVYHTLVCGAIRALD